MKAAGMLAASLFVLPISLYAADGAQWAVTRSTMTYTVDHPLHGTRGTSHAARGKAVCDESGCKFLVASPVNSFSSGDDNRDLHMVQTAKAVQFPMVVVKGALAGVPAEGTLLADLDVEMSGTSRRYEKVPFQVQRTSEGLKLKGTVPMTLTDFKIERPSLLGMPVKDSVPVDVDIEWGKPGA